MPVILPQQQASGWDSNIYVVTITRILVVVGTTYLIRSVYQYVTRLRSPNNGNSIAEATLATGTDLDLESLALGDPSTLTLNIDIDETPNPPAPSYQPSQLPLRPQAHPHQHPRRHRSQRAGNPLATTPRRTVNIESNGGRETQL